MHQAQREKEREGGRGRHRQRKGALLSKKPLWARPRARKPPATSQQTPGARDGLALQSRAASHLLSLGAHWCPELNLRTDVRAGSAGNPVSNRRGKSPREGYVRPRATRSQVTPLGLAPTASPVEDAPKCTRRLKMKSHVGNS